MGTRYGKSFQNSTDTTLSLKKIAHKICAKNYQKKQAKMLKITEKNAKFQNRHSCEKLALTGLEASELFELCMYG